jgi:phospholipid/cholesterol/gamma-HCH transport system substrate-binding protein
LKISRELKIGIVFISALALFIWGYNFMKGKNLFNGQTTTFFSEYQDIQGLNTASKVTINGFQVGKVQNITFNTDPAKKGQLIVEYSMDADFDFSKNSTAKIYSDGLMGGKSLAIVPSYEGEKAERGSYLRGEIESDMIAAVGDKLGPLSSKLESVIVSADSLLVGFNDVLDVSTRNHLKSAVVKLDQAMVNFNDILVQNKVNLEKTLSNAEQITSKFTTFADGLNTELQNAKIAETVQELKTTIEGLNSIVSNLDKSEGTLGMLLNDKEMYTNLANASKELEELLREVKEHPNRFVHLSLFGKKDKTGYVTPENK